MKGSVAQQIHLYSLSDSETEKKKNSGNRFLRTGALSQSTVQIIMYISNY
jgi:hypothetical protein